MHDLDDTHDPKLKSWVDSANTAATDFPIQNLPFGRFRRIGSSDAYRIGVAIGDQVLDLRATGLIASNDMNALMAATPEERRALRAAISAGLAEGSAQRPAWQAALLEQSAVEMTVPSRIGDYTDFYIGIHHATAVGKLFRPDAPLLPNYKWVPIGYHGRASTIHASGHSFARPCGQLKGPQDEVPRLAPTQRLDYELELGVFVGRPNAPGVPISMAQAESHVFGLALFNDWSARDIQAWEYQPLGPFLSKNFASTVSPWIVTLEALAPFRKAFERPKEDPPPMAYLDAPANRERGAIDIDLEVQLQTASMRAQGLPHTTVTRSNFAEAAYWTVAQLVAHHTVNGCALASGDLFGTGTLSGPAEDQAGSLLELTQAGKRPITLPNGEQRTFLQDGDAINLVGRCTRAGYRSIGFGHCAATVLGSPMP
ncbi:MAG TPA: fumarylacetoacetase [Variovorax sp.]|nr:fumarylacetoacetase [Variovorax sp.]